jgi:hypothetical protein
MIMHKVECFKTTEWEVAPVYRYILDLGLDNGKLLFLTFVIMLFVGLFWCFIIISWHHGQLLFLAFWGLTFIVESHHMIRSLISESYYSGLYTGIVYVLFGFIYWRELIKNYQFLRVPAT